MSVDCVNIGDRAAGGRGGAAHAVLLLNVAIETTDKHSCHSPSLTPVPVKGQNVSSFDRTLSQTAAGAERWLGP